jgi:hypothetical protein
MFDCPFNACFAKEKTAYKVGEEARR